MKGLFPLLCIALLSIGAIDHPGASGSPDLAAPRTSSSFLDAGADRVLAALGPPTRIVNGKSSFSRWIWTDPGGVERTLTLCRDRVLHVDPAFDLSSIDAERDRRPADGIYLGQSTTELLERRGNPDEARVISIHAHPGGSGPIVGIQDVVVYGDQWITLAEGRVVRIGKAIPEPPIRGPR